MSNPERHIDEATVGKRGDIFCDKGNNFVNMLEDVSSYLVDMTAKNKEQRIKTGVSKD